MIQIKNSCRTLQTDHPIQVICHCSPAQHLGAQQKSEIPRVPSLSLTTVEDLEVFQLLLHHSVLTGKVSHKKDIAEAIISHWSIVSLH